MFNALVRITSEFSHRLRLVVLRFEAELNGLIKLSFGDRFVLWRSNIGIYASPPNEQLNLTLDLSLRLARAKPQSKLKRKLTRC